MCEEKQHNLAVKEVRDLPKRAPATARAPERRAIAVERPRIETRDKAMQIAKPVETAKPTAPEKTLPSSPERDAYLRELRENLKRK